MTDNYMALVDEHPYSEWISCAKTVLYTPLLLRPVNSAADFGCNCGPWLRVLIDLGITDVVGVDIGDPGENILFPVKKYVKYDLRERLELGRKFDLIIGLETAEHIAGGDEGAENYVQTLTTHGDYILFSAATPGQGGNGHVNEQPHEYWHNKFLSRGFAKLDVIRPAIKDDWRVSSWYRQNCFLYVKPRYDKPFPVYA